MKNKDTRGFETTDTEQHKDKNRRRLALKALGGGGVLAAGNALPRNWAKPVVDVVVLPVHASTTDDTGAEGEGQPTTTPDPCTSGNYTITGCNITDANDNTLYGPAGGLFPAASMGNMLLAAAEATLGPTCSSIAVALSLNYTSGMGGMWVNGPHNAVTTNSGVAVFNTITGMQGPTGTAVFTAANSATCEVPFGWASPMMSMMMPM